MAGKRGRRTKKAGFYERRMRRKDEGPTGVEEEIRRRLREAVCRTPEEKRLLIEALRMLGRKENKAKDSAERVRAVLESLGEQLLPGRNSEE